MVAVVVAAEAQLRFNNKKYIYISPPIESILFDFDFDKLYFVGHWFARFCVLSFVLMILVLVLVSVVVFIFIFVDLSLLNVRLCFTSVCFVDECGSIADIYCSVCPFGCLTAIVIVVFYLPLLCVYVLVYRRIYTTTKTLLIEFRCVTIFEIIFQQIFDECVLYC